MKVLLSTTLGHNPGDEIIAAGVMSIFRRKFSKAEFVLYNRNPDLQHGPLRYARHDTIGNYQCANVDLSYIDAVVIAGSPEWFGPPMEALYDALLENPKPLYVIGIGLGDPESNLIPLEQKILSQASLITTRSTETTAFLAGYGIASHALPCPAFLWTEPRDVPIFPDSQLLIPQAPGTGWHEVNENCLTGISSGDRLLCVHVKELKYYSGLGHKCKYAQSPSEFRSAFTLRTSAFSTRLHGAIGALAMGVPACVISDGDFRIETAAKMFGNLLPIVKNFSEAKERKLAFSSHLADFQDHVWGEYTRLLYA